MQRARREGAGRLGKSLYQELAGEVGALGKRPSTILGKKRGVEDA